MNPPPPLSYLLFVRYQARILGRRAERSGLPELARHYRLQEDWAKSRLDRIFGPLEDYLSVCDRG